MNRELILNFPVSSDTRENCISNIIDWIENGSKGKYFVCANPHSIEIAISDVLYGKAIKNSDLVVPDGIGVVIASKILGGNIKSRITGSDIFSELTSDLNKRGTFSYFFLGSTEENLVRIKNKLRIECPNIKIAGTYAPPFKAEFNEDDNWVMIDAINNAKPDVLWVGMTAPKQEKWIYKNRERLNVKFIGAIGAVFDFYSGSVKRPSPLFQRMGLEWLPRLCREPRRLWRRNMISNPKFMLRVISQKMKGG